MAKTTKKRTVRKIPKQKRSPKPSEKSPRKRGVVADEERKRK